MKDATQVLINKQLNVLMRRLQNDKPLTAAQLRFVEAQLNKSIEPTIGQNETAPTAGDVCSSASQLAKQLGINRQTITYHRQLGNSPDTLSESAWRKYLQGAGKLPTSEKLQKSAAPGESKQDIMSTAFGMAFISLSNALLPSLKVSLIVIGKKLPPRKLDSFTWLLWQLLAHKYQKLANEHDLPGPFDKFEGEYDWPSEIVKLQTRLSTKSPGAEPDEPTTSEPVSV
ncbi:MAG: hypothetical protein ACLP2Y_11605 [Limisphaerales bacterium]